MMRVGGLAHPGLDSFLVSLMTSFKNSVKGVRRSASGASKQVSASGGRYMESMGYGARLNGQIVVGLHNLMIENVIRNSSMNG